MPAPQRSTGQGQWALGHREPLNANERFKKDDDGLNVRQRIENVYAYRGFDAIDPSDLRGRMRWWGLYTQRRPGIGGGLTGSLEPEELDDKFFMLRVRIDGGRLTSEQLRAIADVSTEYGRDTADVTDRQNIQLHWIRIEDMPAIWQRLESTGLSTTEACGDTPRVILGCPLAGADANEILDGTSAINEVARRHIGSPEFSNLPRKFKTAVSGCPDHCTVHEINDISFVGVLGPDGAPGFDLWVGGGLSTNPKLAVRVGVFVTEEQLPDVWAGVTSIFRDYGYRRSRTRARLKFLVSDWGPERFREVLEKEYLGYPLPDGPAPDAPRSKRRDHVGVTQLRDGTSAVGFAPRVGRVSGSLLREIAELSDRFGSGQVRTTTEQKMIIMGVTDVDGLVAGLAALDLQVFPSSFRRSTMACTGLEFCKLAIVETKALASELIDELERRMPEFDEPIGINVNGCPNACARFQVADIGLKGSLIGGEEGFQIHLGGSLGVEAALGRKVRGLKVTARELPDFVERILLTFQSDRAEGESFASWVRRADESVLA
ncbi:MAG TPA: nitrite/sulfite reductase [Frankiaceae bacterium]|jgi:sulfite reductase (ferredoxin)|nr:nitrite/sulfite reductase [Frankiaceae bacterium]